MTTPTDNPTANPAPPADASPRNPAANVPAAAPAEAAAAPPANVHVAAPAPVAPPADDYADIIDLPHYEPRSHPRMPVEARAAQFAPFAALPTQPPRK